MFAAIGHPSRKLPSFHVRYGLGYLGYWSQFLVKRLQVSLLRRGGTTQIIGVDPGVSAQFSSVFYHGVGGLKVDGLLGELPLICELGPRAVIVDIGTNDLSLAGVDPSRLASRIVALAQRVLAVASVSEVVICHAACRRAPDRAPAVRTAC